jgi:hypothetical protein
MPREPDGSGRKTAGGSPVDRDSDRPRSRGSLDLTDELRAALRPWIDLDEVGPEGLRSWLLSIVTLVPRPSAGDHVIDRNVAHGTLEERLDALAHALADCASDRARKNFQAAEYFRENRVLARRLKAVEAMIRARVETGQMTPVEVADPEADAAARRYLPRSPG